MRERQKIQPGACSWCGHDPHDGACPDEIQTGTAKDPRIKPCPCIRRKK